MKLFSQQRFAQVACAVVMLFLATGATVARAGVSISMGYPLAATPCDSLSVTTTVVNTGATLSQLQVNELLPGGLASYSYVTNSMQINIAGAGTLTNEASVLTDIGGTNLVFNLSNIQTTNGPTNLLLSEVFPGPVADQQWIEIYNPTVSAVTMAGWSVKDARPGVTQTLPTYTIQPGRFLVVAASTNSFRAANPTFTNTAALIQVAGGLIGNGLAQYADGVFLMNSNGVVVDKISWGYDTSAFNPAVPYPSTTTASLARVPANVTTSTANDWTQLSVPTPGTGTVLSGLASGTTVTIVYQLLAKCGGVGGYFNTTATYQQPAGGATQTNNLVDFIAFANPVLILSKTPQIQQANLGGLVTWQLQVVNSGFGTAHNTVMYDSIGSGLTFVGFSIPPTTPNPTATNAVYWDASAIPALVGLTNGQTPISITVTARVSACGLNLNNRGDASFGCDTTSPCQDTRLDSSGATSAIEYLFNRPFLSLGLTPTNPIAVPYCGGINVTLTVTNNNYANGADAYAVGVSPYLVSGYTLTLTNGAALPTNSSGALIVSPYLAKGATTNIILHLQPGGVCPLNTNQVAQLLEPVYSDNCGLNYSAPIIPMLTYLSGLSAAAVTEAFSPSAIQAGTTTNVTVMANLLYTNMGSGIIPQNIVVQYPATGGWGVPTNITGIGVLNTNAHTVTWTTNVSGSGSAIFTFRIPVTKGVNCTTNGTDYFPLTPATYFDCQGCPQVVDTNSLSGAISTYGCICTNCTGSGGGGGTNCTFTSLLSTPLPLVETCAAQPFTMLVTNLTGTYPGRWTNVAWTASLSGSFAYNSSSVHVSIGGTDITTNLVVSLTNGTLMVKFDNLNHVAAYTNLSTVTNLLISWDAGVSQSGNVTQVAQFNLCTASAQSSSWTVGTSVMNITLNPPFLGFECGKITIPIGLHQMASPYSLLQQTNGLFPDYNVDVVLNLDPTDDPNALGIGTPIPSLSYVTNSTVLAGIITNAAGHQLILTNVPVLTNNLVIWHLGNLGVFTNGTINCQFQMRCGGAPIQNIQAVLRYNDRCDQGTLPQVMTNSTPQQLVSDQSSILSESVTPALVTMTTTNFNFQAQFFNNGASAAHNFFIEVQVPTNIVLTSATVPWNYVYALNSGTNAYRWTFTNNAAPVQGLVDDLSDGSFNDLSYEGQFTLMVTGAVISCVNQQINTIAGSGCFGTVCQQVGPIPVNLETLPGKAVAMLVFPTALPICQTNALYYVVRNASLSSLYQVTPSFYLPSGLTYISGSAVATNKLTGQHISIPDPSGAGTQANPFVWTAAQVSYLSELVSANDVTIGFQVKVACDSVVSGEGGASATYLDACHGFNQTALELSAGNIGVPVLSLTKAYFDLHGNARSESTSGETNVFYLTIQPTAASAATVQAMQLMDFFPTNSFKFLGASIHPDLTNSAGVLVWSNSTLMASIPNQNGGPYYVTSAPISLVITSVTLANCSSPAVNSAVVNYGCADSLCQSASGSASVIMTPSLQFGSGSQSMQLNTCGGTYTTTIANNGSPASGIILTNYAPAGYLIAAATVSGALTNPVGQTATLTLGGSPFAGKFAVLNLSNTNLTNVRGSTNYAGTAGAIYLGPGQSFTVTYTLVPDGSLLGCTVNTYPPAATPVTTTNGVTYNNFCGSPAVATSTYTTLPDQPEPTVDLQPKSIIVTNGQVQNFVVTISNIADHGNASDLEARILFQNGWTNLVILGVTNNTAGGSTNTGAKTITIETNAQNAVLADLGGVVIEPLETVVIGVQAKATQNGSPLAVKAEVVGECGVSSPNACSTFSPTNPLAMTVPPSTDIIAITNHTIYGFYQDNANGVGFNLTKTVRYSGESSGVAGTNRVARIGEPLVYQITAQYFDAPFTNIIVNDSLPPNLVYGTPVNVAGATANVTNWTFNPANGNFILPTPITNNATFIVDFPVTVTNGLLNQAGITFTNTASSSFTTVVTNQPPSASTVVSNVEPTLSVSTLVSSTPSNFGPSLANVQAGDLIYYQIVITNLPGTNAYNLWLSNSLPAGFTALTVVSVASTGSVITNGVAAGGTLINSLLNFTNSSLNLGTNAVEMDTNSSITIIISAKPGYTVQPNQLIADQTTIQWTSMPGAVAQERTGVGLIPPVGVNDSTNNTILNNYADTSAATITAIKNILFSKVLVGTDHTAPGNTNVQAVIGEHASYTLTLTIPQGITTNAIIVDTLPGGMAFVGVTNVSWSAGVSNSQPITVATNPANTTVTGAGQTISFNLGNVTNLNNNDVASSIAITFQSVVLDVTTNRSGTNLVNAAQFTTGSYSTNVVSAQVTVVEPGLQITELVATNLAGVPGVFTSSVNTLQANDLVYYAIIITNADGLNNTTAYDLYVSNSLPAGLINPSVYSVTANTNLGNVFSNGVPQIGTLSTSLFGFNNNNVLTNTASAELDLATNSAIVVIVSAQLSPTFNVATSLVDTNTIEWSSLPGTQTNLSAYNPASNERTGVSTPLPAPGVNNFTTTTLLDNYAAAASASLTTITPSFAKVLLGTDHTVLGNTNNQAVIGERASYTLTLTMPQGVLTNANILDTLPKGLAFVGVTNVSYSVGVSNSTPITVGTNPANTSYASGNTTVTFNLGNITNANSSDVPSTLAITLQLVVMDTNFNRAGSTSTNKAKFNSTQFTSSTITSASVTVVEPQLQITELVSTNPAGVFTPSVSTVQANDTVYYQIVITNGAGANNTIAYNLFVSNALPAGLVNPTVYSVTAYTNQGSVFSNGVPQIGALSTSLFGINNNNVLTNTSAAALDLATNSAIIVIVSAQLSPTIAPLTVLIDTNTIEWQSLPGAQTNQSAFTPFGTLRSGISTPLPGANVNNYTNLSLLDNYAAAAAASVTVIPPSFSKVLVGTSLTNPGNGTTNVTVGELVSYSLTLTVPQGVMTAAQIVDTLPTNLAFVDVTNVAWSANLSNSQPITVATNPANTVVANSGNLITFNLGNVTNANVNDAASSLTIKFRAVVLDVLTNQAGTNFVNTAVFTSGTFSTNVASAGVQVVEPTLQITELVSTNATSGFAASAANIQAGNTLYYQLTITNSAGLLGTTAYDLWLSNSLPAGLINPTVVAVTNVGVGNVYSNGVAVTGALSTSLFSFTGTQLGVGSSELDLDTNGAIVVTVAAQVGYGVNPLAALPDETTIEWSSLPGTQTNLSAYNSAANERTGVTAPLPAAGVNNSTNNSLLNNYAAASAVSVSTVSAPLFSKVLTGTDHSAPGNGTTNVVIGELVSYTLTLSIPQGVTTNASIVDTLPVGLAFVGVTNVSWSPNVSNSQPITTVTNPANTTITGTGHSITFNLGNVTNLNSSYATNGLSITFQAVVLDVLTNQASTNWVNPATFTSGSYTTNVTSAGVQVVEPTLQISELISGSPTGGFTSALGNVDAGDTVYYQLVITNSAGLLGTTAYNLWLSNSLLAGLINPAVYSVTNTGVGNVYSNGVAVTGSLSTNLFGFNGSLLGVGSSVLDLDTNGAIVVVVAAQLSGSLTPGLSLADNTTIEWSSLPGAQTNLSAYNSAANERTGVSTPLPAPGVNNSTNNGLLDNYAAASGVIVATLPEPVLSKGIIAADESGVTGNSGVTGTNATIGELVTYRITVDLPEGTTTNLVVTDQLPAGLALVTNSMAIVPSRPANANTGIPGTGTEAFGGTVSLPTITPATATNGALAFTFGPITVNSDNDTNNNVFALTYQAVVLNIATNSGLANAQTKWTNTFTWVAGLANSNGLSDASGNVVAVVEPNLNFSQTLLVDGIPGQTCAYLGSPVMYTLTVRPASNSLSTAFNVGFSDQLPLPIGATATTPLTMANVVITNSAGVDLRPYFTLVGGLLQTTNGSTLSLATNDNITIVVNGVVNSSVAPVGGYTNIANLAYSTRNGDYTTNAGFNPNPFLTTDQERPYGATNNTALTLNIDSISGFVYADTNNDAIKQGGETGLAGVTVTLTGTNVEGQIITLSTNTAVDGSYFFGSLLPGGYIVTRTTTPATYIDGKETAGTPFGGVVNNNTNSAVISAVNIPTCGSYNGVNYNFGLIQPDSLAGMVFADLNRNGLYDGPDYPITNVTVTLTGTNYQGTAITNVMTTLTNGTYSFTGLLPGTYAITETQPAGYGQGTNALGSTGGTNSAQDVFSNIVLGQNQNGTNYNYGETLVDTIAGYVYADANNDGIFQNTETPLSGVTVTLTGTNLLGQVITLSTNTAVNGSYFFGNLLPGNYVLNRATTPATYIDGKETAGTPFGGAVDNSTTSSTSIASITIPVGGSLNGVNYDFGLIQPNGLSGTVFADLNRNGIQDGVDYPITNVTVTLTGTNFLGTVISNVMATLPNGTYDFTGLLPGTYTITETQPAGYGQGTNALGTAGGTNSAQDVFSNIVLGQNQGGINYNFGETLVDSIAGYVYADASNDGIFQNTETPLAGVTVTLTGTNLLGQVITLSTNTAVDGSYYFGNLLPGNYVLNRTTTPATYIDGKETAGTPFGGTVDNATFGSASITGITIPIGGSLNGVNYNFGLIQPNSVAGTVFADLDRNGIEDGADYPITNVTVTLTGTNYLGTVITNVMTTLTNGTYAFTGLLPGTYVVAETQPAGYGQGTNALGTTGGTNSAQDVFSGIVLDQNQHGTDYNFGETVVDSIAGYVYADGNNDGIFQNTETPLAGVTVTLIGTNVEGQVITLSTNTAADGSYYFGDLLPGNYVLDRTTTPATYIDGKETGGTPFGGAVDNTTPGSTDIVAITIPVGGSLNGVNYNFGLIQPNSLAGTVFADLDRDGLENGVDYPITNVTVTLTGTNYLGLAITNVMQTLPDGSYEFTGLLPGTYAITETQPAGYGQGTNALGTTGGTNSAQDVFSGIVLGQNQNGTNYNFGETIVDSIAGYVYADASNDGIFQNTETPLSVVTVTLTGTNIEGQVITLSTNTAPDGSYYFGNLLPGGYVVDRMTTPLGYVDGKETAGTPFGGVVDNSNTNSTVITSITIPAGGSYDGVNYNLGLIQPNSLAGIVFADLDRDGLENGGDYPLTNVTVTLTGTDYLGNALTNVMQTLADGSYVFTGLLPGTYAITETQPAGYGQGTNALGTTGGTNSALDVFSSIVLDQNQHGVNYNFGETVVDSIAGYVYADANNDGIFQGGELPLSGVTVTLTGTNLAGQVITLSTNTLPDGSYYFGNLLPGNYVLDRTTTPASYIDGKETAGTPFGGTVNNLTDSTVITSITIPTGGSFDGVNYDFGLIQPNSVAGLVFADLNRDGIVDGTDYPITNVTVTLTGTDDRGNSISNVLQTLADGTYDFTGLRTGTYTITETQPTGYGQGTNALGTTGGTNSALDVFSGIALDQNQNGVSYNFGETLGTIGSYVWIDVNADGIRQPAEQGLPGVRVFLDVNHDGQYETNEPSSVTDSQGYYLITNLLGTTYSVVVATNTLPVGASETYDLDGTNTQSKVVALVLPPGDSVLNANFGYRYVSPTLATLQAGSFQGVATNGVVLLQWTTLSEADTVDYVVNRQDAAGNWNEAAFALALDSAAGGYYNAEDSTATTPGTYLYQLVEERMDGTSQALGYCTVVVGSSVVMTIQTEGANVRLSWTGGTAPYHLYECTSLTPSAGSKAASKVAGASVPASNWVEVPLTDPTANTVSLPMASPAAFFRVSSGQ